MKKNYEDWVRSIIKEFRRQTGNKDAVCVDLEEFYRRDDIIGAVEYLVEQRLLTERSS